MIKNILFCSLVSLAVSPSLQGMQQYPKPIQTNSSSSTPAYLNTISEWLSDNPLLLAASALGIGSVGGYFLYAKWKKQTGNGQHDQSVNHTVPQRPIGLVQLKTLKTTYPLAATYALHTKQPSRANAGYTSLTAQPRAVQPQNPTEAERKYEKEYQEKQRVNATQSFLNRIYDEYKFSPSGDEVIGFYNDGRKVLQELFRAEETDEYGYVTVDRARDVAYLTAKDIRNFIWFLYIHAMNKSMMPIFPQNVGFSLVGTDDQITVIYNAFRLAQVGSTAITDTNISSLYSMYLGELPPHAEEALDYARINNTLYLKTGDTKSDVISLINNYLMANRVVSQPVAHMYKKTPEEIISFIEQFKAHSNSAHEQFENKYRNTEWYHQAIDYISEADQKLASYHNREISHANMSHWQLTKDIPLQLGIYAQNEDLERIYPKFYGELKKFAQELSELSEGWLQRHTLNKLKISMKDLLAAPELPLLQKNLTSSAIQKEQQAFIYTH